jgi:hypothetical protein
LMPSKEAPADHAAQMQDEARSFQMHLVATCDLTASIRGSGEDSGGPAQARKIVAPWGPKLLYLSSVMVWLTSLHQCRKSGRSFQDAILKLRSIGPGD